MKKNLVFVTATKAGILVGVKTKLSGEELAKVKQNEERVNKLLEDVHAVIVFIEPSVDDFNFAIGSYSSGEVSTEAIQVEASNMKSAMDQLKDWLKTVPAAEPAKEEKPTTEFEIAVDAAFKTLKKHFPDCGFGIIGLNPENKSGAMAGNINAKAVIHMFLLKDIIDENG